MFCYKECCTCKCIECEELKRLDNLKLDFKDFTSEEDIEMAQEILCLVSSWGEPPYFLVMERKERGICNSFDGSLLDNTEILRWTYLPAVKL